MSAEENVTLATDTAQALLEAIKKGSGSPGNPEGIKHLCEAYALVRGAMPKPTSGPVGVGGFA